MSKMTPQEMARHIGKGLLSFPVTPFRANYAFDE
jgi:5-dehydro-4-deoxyglucarate dehydratase